jgi:hypothetical protein
MEMAASAMSSARMIFAKARDGLDLPVMAIVEPSGDVRCGLNWELYRLACA